MHCLSFQESLRRNAAPLDDAPLARALEMLWQAHRYAAHADMDIWDFAVEIDEFHRGQISNSDLRWLLSQNLALHADEKPSTNGKRRFSCTPSTSLNERSCFIIAVSGIELLEASTPTVASTAFAGQELGAHAALRSSSLKDAVRRRLTDPAKPSWNALRRELRVGEQVVKRFRRPAPSQQAVLDVFQAAHWPTHIVDPLPLKAALCPKRRLHDAIKRLNRRHRLAAIRFYGDGSGLGVLWDLIG